MSVNFHPPVQEARLIDEIVERAKKLDFGGDLLSLSMDICACHLNGCPLDLEKLLKADDFNFAHDIVGIFKHMDRKTGQLKDCFLPRSAKEDSK